MSASGPAVGVVRDLAAIVGGEHVCAEAAALDQFRIEEVSPGIVVAPGSAAEVAAVVRFANERGLVVVPAGGFTQQRIGKIPPRVDVVLRTTRLQGIENYDPGDLTITVGAGTTMAQVDAAIAPHRQLLPVDAANPDQSTIGGVLAAAAHGPLKHAYGGVREFCVGVKFVTGDGILAKAGGRVVKNVAGYDLMKLLIGSYGTLAVIVGASFKLFPRPRQTRTFVCEFPNAKEALRFRDFLVQSALTPLCLELASPLADRYLMGAAKAGSWRVLVRAGGTDAVLGRYAKELGSASAREISGDGEVRLWRAASQFAATVVAQHRTAMVLQISVPPACVGAAFSAAEGAALDNNFLMAATSHAAAGSLTVTLIPIAEDAPAVMQYVQAASAIRAALPRDASAVVTLCPAEAKAYFDVCGSSPNDVATMRSVKRALDPNDILNRGRFLF